MQYEDDARPYIDTTKFLYKDLVRLDCYSSVAFYRNSSLMRSSLGPVCTGMQSFHFFQYCSEKWNAEGLRSHGNTSNRTIPFQKMERRKKRYENWNAEGLRSDGNTSNRTIPFQKMERRKKRCEKWNAEGLRSDGNTSNRIIPFQKMERPKTGCEKWNGTQ